MNNLIKAIKITSKNILLAFCSLFWKRDKSIVLMGAWFGTKFADNTRFLFQYLNKEKTNLGLSHVVWVTHSPKVCKTMGEMGYEVYMMNSAESIYYHKKAGYHIICNASSQGKFNGDILGQYSYGAVKINLWHGMASLKGVDFASREYINKKNKHKFLYSIKEFLINKSSIFRTFYGKPGGWGNCYFLSTTKEATEIFKKLFLLPQRNYIESGYPRNCEALRLTNEEIHIIATIKKFPYTILYLPTFREGNKKQNLAELPFYLKKELAQKKILWIQKGHSADGVFEKETDNTQNIISLNSDFDINVLYRHITLIITDYSSVMIDAVYYDKPVWFYVPDYDEYMNGNRGFISDPNEIMCGPKFMDIVSLKQALDFIDRANVHIEKYDYHYLKKKYWSSQKSLSEIWNDIIDQTS